jgi:hypothetical protein
MECSDSEVGSQKPFKASSVQAPPSAGDARASARGFRQNLSLRFRIAILPPKPAVEQPGVEEPQLDSSVSNGSSQQASITGTQGGKPTGEPLTFCPRTTIFIHQTAGSGSMTPDRAIRIRKSTGDDPVRGGCFDLSIPFFGTSARRTSIMAGTERQRELRRRRHRKRKLAVFSRKAKKASKSEKLVLADKIRRLTTGCEHVLSNLGIRS